MSEIVRSFEELEMCCLNQRIAANLQGQTGGLRRRSTRAEFLASGTEPFSDAVALRACVTRTDNFENYNAALFRRTHLWAVRRRLWHSGVPFHSCILPFV